MQVIISSILSGLVATILTVLITSNQIAKSDGEFQGKTSSGIQANSEELLRLNKSFENLSSIQNNVVKSESEFRSKASTEIRVINEELIKINRVLDLISAENNALKLEVLNKSSELNKQAKILEQELTLKSDLLFKDMTRDISLIIKKIDSIKIPKRNVVSNMPIREGSYQYLFNKQVLIAVESINIDSKEVFFKITYPDNSIINLENVSEKSRGNFKFMDNVYVVDVNSISSMDSNNKLDNVVYVTVTRSVLN